MNRKKFGEKVRQKRQENGFSYEELAKILNINPGYLKQIETGKKVPALPLLISFCEVLHTSPNYLMEFAEDCNVKKIIEKCYEMTPYQLKALDSMITAYREFEKMYTGQMDDF